MRNKDKYDDMLIDIGSRMFDLQILLAGFIREIMDELGKFSIEIDFKFPIREGDDYNIIHGKEIHYDPEENKLMVLTMDSGKFILWHEIDVLTQEILANDLHMRYVAEGIYKDLS